MNTASTAHSADSSWRKVRDLVYMNSILDRLSEELSRFYAAEITLALKSMHSKSIMHRDLKPENVLLDQNLHLKIVNTLLTLIILDVD